MPRRRKPLSGVRRLPFSRHHMFSALSLSSMVFRLWVAVRLSRAVGQTTTRSQLLLCGCCSVVTMPPEVTN